MDRNCEVCKHHTEKGCCKWECQFDPKLSERDLHFRYLDGCADGLNEARKDTIRELEKVKEEIGEEFVDLQDGSEEWRSYVNDAVLSCYEIVEKHIAELKGGAE